MCVAACAAAPQPAPPPAPTSTSTATGVGVIDPARIDRARDALPPGYEVSAVGSHVTPLAQWGFGADATAEPAVCAGLAGVPVDPAGARGWLASGAGGIVYAVAADGPAGIDASARDQCPQWAMSAGPTTGTVRLVDAPAIGSAATLGMAADIRTVVEGGNETRSHADTFVAAEQGRLVYVTVVTDPGSPDPALGADLGAQLLTKTVAALRR